MTVDEFLALTDADPRRMELIDGEIVVVNHPRFAHGRMQALLSGAIVEWERRDALESPLLPGFSLAVGELFDL